MTAPNRAAPVSVRADGPCLEGTQRALEVGVGARPMLASAVDKVRADALSLLDFVVSTYADEVAVGEIGADGSAGPTMPLHDPAPVSSTDVSKAEKRSR